MATITKYRKKNGELSYSATVRVKQGGKVVFSASRSFPKESLAKDWAKRTEIAAAAPGFIEQQAAAGITLGEILARYRDEMERSERLGRSKGYTLQSLLRTSLADSPPAEIETEDYLDYGRSRQAEGVSPATIFQDFSAIQTALTHAKTSWRMPIDTTRLEAALAQLRSAGIVGKSRQRDRRPTEDELLKMLEWLASRQAHQNGHIPHCDIVRFAIATCMRLSEIGRICWADVDEQKRLVLVRERKDPSNKYTNDQWLPLLGVAWDILQAQPRIDERVFPYNMQSVSAAWERGCKALGINNLRFHDLRHHGVSILFEQGLAIQEVAMVSGHKTWTNLKRYTNLRPESLHDKLPRASAEPSRLPLITSHSSGALYMGGWQNAHDMAAAFHLDNDDLAGVDVIFAADCGEDGSCVVFVDNGSLFASICPGAARDWLPEPTNANKLRHRAMTGRIGKRPDGTNTYARQLVEIIAQMVAS
ncbi:site-specific integrase [Chromobacterium subtsugae]|uniref:Site-specific integrase n=1 Tax=Chromobacterium subtsugae TaxID=251747 RepID=A0ABS7FCM2_9NEIS|nr:MULTISPECIES: site-specific integrase [Chromobacterium]KUM04204.1 integrase [Chromobacterium subtsugae]KZE85695.1 integrase [Chromobacterium sp. F49]MBW7566322.1 site-specific integrase [Chromobacterium subtsugae]MBW8287819.1 site-specific integrase [Chromobacterium subtsugae]WSE91148.1 site-specific integrase [Chromobacterium subtsugae]